MAEQFQSPPPQLRRYEKTDRSLLKFVLLGFITFGIYQIVVLTESVNALNRIATPRDCKHTMHYCLMFFLFGWMTCGIAWLVYWHRLSTRLGDQLESRGLHREISARDYWLWGVLGCLIIVGPFVFMYKYLHAMNSLCKDYDERPY